MNSPGDASGKLRIADALADSNGVPFDVAGTRLHGRDARATCVVRPGEKAALRAAPLNGDLPGFSWSRDSWRVLLLWCRTWTSLLRSRAFCVLVLRRFRCGS